MRTRQATWAKNLVPKFARTDQRKFSFSVRTVERWNRQKGSKPGGLQKEKRTKIFEFQRNRATRTNTVQRNTSYFRKRLKNSNF